MEDNGKLILWGTLVVILLIIIGIINPFFADTDYHYLYLSAILVTLFYWNGTKFEISVVIIPFSEIENFVPFSNIQ